MERQRLENRINKVLQHEKQTRVVGNGEGPLLWCVGKLVQAKACLLEEYIRSLITNYSSRFKVSLAQMLKEIPVQESQEKDVEYSKRLDTFYSTVISDLATNNDKKYRNIYLYAVATVLQTAVYVLMEDESRRLSWFYFPPLFDVNVKEVLPASIRLKYLTLFMDLSTSACLPITSNDEEAGPPQATGYIGMQYACLTAENADSICIPDEIMKQREGLLSNRELAGLIDKDIIHACSEMMLEKGVIDQETSNRFCFHALGKRQRQEFVEVLQSSEAAFEIFCKILLVRNKKVLLDCLEVSTNLISAGTCTYLSKYVALKDLERAIVNRANYVNRLRQACLDNSSKTVERRRRINWAVIGGSTTGIVGGVLFIVGLALTPVTAGVSLGLTIAGAAVGAASGTVSGRARGYEAYKQLDSINGIKAIQNKISELEINVQERLRVVESLFVHKWEQPTETVEEGLRADLRGFLAVGSALRSAHGFVSIGFAAARIGASTAAVAASVLGPLSLVVDICFLLEAGYNKKKGNKVTTADQLLEMATVVEMKSKIMKSIWSGNVNDDQFIVH